MTEFREIVVLGSPRSGSNLLCSNLREVDGNTGFFEIFSGDRVEGLQWHPAVQARACLRLGIGDEASDSPALIAARDHDPVAFFDALSKAAREQGARSISCKIFGKQISLTHLEAILRRPDLRIIFLSRRRIDRYISAEKARITGQYIKTNSTELRPSLSTIGFLQSAFEDDRDLEAMYQSVRANGVPCSYLNYDRDLDVEPDLRKARISAALNAIGISDGVSHARPENWLVKQDQSSDWRAKIANGFQTGAALAGCGLLAYAQEAPLETLFSVTVPVAWPSRPALLKGTNPLDEHCTCAVLWHSPLLTVTSIQNQRSPLADFMSGANRAFGDRKGLHFLRPSWSTERASISDLARVIARAEASNPGHVFWVLHASDKEAMRYRDHGIRSILGNSNIFADERIWAEDAPPLPGLVPADALYIARLADFKNHHLAARLQSPLFVYGQRELKADPDLLEKLRSQFPSAQFVNHVVGERSYKQLPHDLLARVMSSARVGLALSQVEGAMRASMEYLLSGLPIVSVASIGGREAFFDTTNSLAVDATPEAVQAGVAEMVSRKLTRQEVRRATLRLVEDARRAFLGAANRVAQQHLGVDAPEIAIAPLLGHINRYQTMGVFLGALR